MTRAPLAVAASLGLLAASDASVQVWGAVESRTVGYTQGLPSGITT